MRMTDEAYRRYLIRFNLLGDVWIEKDGQLIAHATGLDDAKRQIDDLLD